VDEEGKRLGEFLTDDARQLARDRGLDLVEVAANANPPVCRIADYGKIKYERKRAKSESRRKTSQLKELKVRPKTDDHDLAVKIRLARKFLENGDKVKVRVWFRGREHAHHDIGADQCLRMAEGVSDVGKIESHPRMDGRNMIMVLAPT
jgi:translation initiation factor IF-3